MITLKLKIGIELLNKNQKNNNFDFFSFSKRIYNYISKIKN